MEGQIGEGELGVEWKWGLVVPGQGRGALIIGEDIGSTVVPS